MFDGLAHVWTVATTQTLGRDKPMAIEVAGERVVVFRDASGAALGERHVERVRAALVGVADHGDIGRRTATNQLQYFL